MGILDIFVIAILVLFVFLGLTKGLIKQVSSMISWILALIIPLLFTDNVMNFVVEEEKQDFFTSAIVFAVLFILSFIIARLLGKFISGAVNKTPLTLFDKLLGGGWGLIKGLIIISLIFLLFQWIVSSPFGNGLSDFLTKDLKLDTDQMTVARYLYENNLITLALEKFKSKPLELFTFVLYN